MILFSKKYFDEISGNEKIIKVIHRHWFDIFQQFIAVILLVIVLFAGFFVFPSIFPTINGTNSYPVVVFMATLFFLLLWVYAFLIWIDYYFDIWIITSERVVNVEQKGLFLRTVSELKYNRIQDVTADVKGFFPTVLNYGDVHVQTAGEQSRFNFRHIPDPYRIKNLIMDLHKHRDLGSHGGLGKSSDFQKVT